MLKKNVEKHDYSFGINFFIVLVLAVLSTAGLGYMSFSSQIFPFMTKVIITAAFIYVAKDTRYFKPILIFCFLLAIVWICSGAGFRYGRLNSLVITAVMGTDQLEVGEFITTISWRYPLLALIYIFFSAILLLKYSAKPLLFSYRRAALLLILLVFSSFGAFSIRFVEQYRSYMQEKALMASSIAIAPDWQIQSVVPRYKNYVVVIGESVNKDYMSLYGYRLPTTPFLDKAAITYASQYVAPASYTYPSLSRMLTLDNEPSSNPANHAVTLANEAGFETYWLSNQGFLGKTDTRVAAIASKGKHTFFLKQGAYNSINIDDWELFPHIAAALKEPTESSKVIFVHIMGSHPMACERLFDFPNRFNEGKGKHFDCYLASIQKTDLFLKQLYEMLNQHGETYSLMYLGDHGMAIEADRKVFAGASDLGIYHGHHYQQNFRIPLLWMDYTQTQRREIDRAITGFDFIHLYASWLGVTEVRIKSNCMMEECAFSDNPLVFDGDKNKPYNSLPVLPMQ